MTDVFSPPSFGWRRDPQAVAEVCAAIEARGRLVALADVAPHLIDDSDDPVFFWDVEQSVLGGVLGSWNQGQVGTCVSFGYGRGAQDLILLEAAQDRSEQWPGAEVATEPIYAGSRVEVGGGRISGDGSVGAWAAEWLRRWGVVLRRVYGPIDLRTYSESRSREWGRAGCPDSLEPIAREHPVAEIATVKSAAELWAALGARKPVPVCSDQGFTTTLEGGFCRPSGTWNHCMLFRGRFLHPQRGKSVVIQNSWGGYLSGERFIEATGRGKVHLPEGCFAVPLDVAGAMCSQGDTFALAGLRGWVKEKIDWTP